MEKQALGSVIYVAVKRVHGTATHPKQLFRGNKETGFFHGGMTFDWLGDTLTVTGVRGGHIAITRLDEPVEIENSSSVAYRVAVFPTEPKALAFLAKPVKMSVAA